MDPRINVITLGVRDLASSLAFYRDGLGWRTLVQGDIAFIPLNGIICALYPREKLAEDATVPPQGDGFPGFTLAYNARDEAEADAILELVKKLGARIVKPAAKTFWGGYGGYFSDPDGFLWEVAYNPFWDFDEIGNIRM